MSESHVCNVPDRHPVFPDAHPSMATHYSTLALIILSLLLLALLAREWSRMERRVGELMKRVRDLEQANLQRLPYKSYEEILNAMAALDKEMTERTFYNSLIENAKAHLTNAMSAGTKREQK